MMRNAIPILLATLLVAGCATPPPPKAPPPAPAPPPPPAPVTPPPPTDWRDLPLSPGSWTYAAEEGGSVARFGPADATALEIRCDRTKRTILVVRAGSSAGPMTITTSYTGRDWPVASGPAQTIASIAAADPFLDRIAFSRGRFSVALPGMPLLMVPAWAEPARVIEDCRS